MQQDKAFPVIQILAAVAGLLAAAAVVGVAKKYVDKEYLTVIITIIFGLVGFLAAAEFPRRADQRARIANSIEIGRRWDSEPLLNARKVVYYEVGVQQIAQRLPDQISAKSSETDVRVRRAVVDFANYYWEIAEVVETRWADDAYIYERFRTTLEELFPALQKLLDTDNPSEQAAFEAIATLHLNWRLRENKRRKAVQQPIGERITALKERIVENPLVDG